MPKQDVLKEWSASPIEPFSQLVLDAGAMALWQWQLDTGTLQCSEQLWTLLTQSKVPNSSENSFFALLNKAEQLAIESTFRNAWEKQSTFVWEFTFRYQGQERCLRFSGGPVVGPAGESLVAGTLTDCTPSSADRREQEELAQARYVEQLEYQRNHDPLTQLPNRHLLYRHLETCINNRKADQYQALLIVDLDRFKEINDTLGHHVGDKLIQALGPRLQSEMQGMGAMVARLGGDEFAIFLNSIRNNQHAVICAHRVLDAIRQEFNIDGFCMEVSASIGVAMCPDQAQDVSAMMRCADIAMYHAKTEMQGVSIYRPEIDMHSEKRLALMSDLGRAIREDQLLLHFQPKIDVETGKTYGLEALLRWHHPELGFIPPNEFIPIAENTNLIHPMTLWVLEKAIGACKRWRDSGYDLAIAVNLSVRNLLDEKLASQVEALLNRFDFLPAMLELEITESAIMANPARAMRSLEALHELGVAMAIDDFGTGYSSLAYLKRLPVSSLKIDSAFVTNLLLDKQDEIIVNSTINLAHNLGLSVVAEGVENEPVLARLRDLGCDNAQGYFIGRPMSEELLETWITNDHFPACCVHP